MTQPTRRRLRVAHVVVQPVLVWDDGDELVPGPQAEPQRMPLSALSDLVQKMPAELERLAATVAPGAEGVL